MMIVLVESVYLQFSAIDAAVIFICYTCLNLIFCKDNANERNGSLLLNSRVQLIFSKDNANERNESLLLNSRMQLIFCKDNANWLQCKTFSFVFMTFTYYMEVIAKIVPYWGLMSAFVLLACENDKEYMRTERLSFSSQYAAFYTMKDGILRCNTWLFVF